MVSTRYVGETLLVLEEIFHVCLFFSIHVNSSMYFGRSGDLRRLTWRNAKASMWYSLSLNVRGIDNVYRYE